jgi:hypothetical protein
VKKKPGLKVRASTGTYSSPPSSGGYGASSTSTNNAFTHHHYHNTNKHDYGAAEGKDQSCFCTIGKVGYMQPSYGGGGHGHHEKGHGEGKDSQLLGVAIGLPVTAGVLALLTGLAAFLIVLAANGVGREGTTFLNELRTKSISRVLQLRPDPVITTTMASHPVFNGGFDDELNRDNKGAGFFKTIVVFKKYFF